MMSVTGSKRSRMVWLVTGLSCLVLTLQGCSEKGGGTRFGNLAPETFITVGPKEESCNYYKVQAYWYGSDLDGRIERFEVATVRGHDLALVRYGDYDGLAWTRTTVTESTFVLMTDSCCAPGGDAQYTLSDWALLVRAVDNNWAKDPEPATLFFQTCNVIPKVRITMPYKLPVPYMDTAPHPYVEWEGQDPDGEATELQYKYIVIPEADLKPDIPRLPPYDQVDTAAVEHEAPSAGYWSEWVAADCTFVKDLDLSEYAGLGSDHLVRFYVTVKDEADAVLPEDLYRSYADSRNWLAFNVVQEQVGLLTIIDGGIVGRRYSYADYQAVAASLFSGVEIRFLFWAEEEPSSSGKAEAYRYFFDDPDNPSSSTWNRWVPVDPIRDPGRRPEWTARFPPGTGMVSPSLGQHVFVVEVRDVNDLVSHCEFYLDVLESPRGKPGLIYLVDDDVADGLDAPYPWREQGEDSLWAEILEVYNYNVFDTGPAFEKRVSARLLSDATTVVWAVDEDISLNTQLLRVCTEYGGFLHSYVRAGGNLVIIGLNPIYAHAYWPDDRWDPRQRATVTSYDFRPPSIVGPDSVVNFNWDILGMERMQATGSGTSVKTLCPCEAGWDTVHTRTIPGYPEWEGELDKTILITDVRDDITVHKLYGVVPLDADGEPGEPDCGRWLAVYVPGDETRGHAAYVGFPPYLCDPDQVKTMVRHLLDLFGEQPVNP